MDAVIYSDLRKNLKGYMDHVYNDHEPLIISRRNNKNLVLLSIDDYNSLTETNYLLSSGKNRAHLISSLNNARNGDCAKKNLIEE